MIEQLSQESISEYAENAYTIELPKGTDYTQGVKVGKTVPAKWWNWLFNALTKRLTQTKVDSTAMMWELQNVVTSSGTVLDSSKNTQLSEAIDAKALTNINKYVEDRNGWLNTWRDTGVLKSTDNVWYNESTGQLLGVDGNGFILASTDGHSYHRSNMTVTEVGATRTDTNDSNIKHYYTGNGYFAANRDSASTKYYFSQDAITWYRIATVDNRVSTTITGSSANNTFTYWTNALSGNVHYDAVHNKYIAVVSATFKSGSSETEYNTYLALKSSNLITWTAFAYCDALGQTTYAPVDCAYLNGNWVFVATTAVTSTSLNVKFLTVDYNLSSLTITSAPGAALKDNAQYHWGRKCNHIISSKGTGVFAFSVGSDVRGYVIMNGDASTASVLSGSGNFGDVRYLDMSMIFHGTILIYAYTSEVSYTSGSNCYYAVPTDNYVSASPLTFTAKDNNDKSYNMTVTKVMSAGGKIFISTIAWNSSKTMAVLCAAYKGNSDYTFSQIESLKDSNANFYGIVAINSNSVFVGRFSDESFISYDGGFTFTTISSKESMLASDNLYYINGIITDIKTYTTKTHANYVSNGVLYLQ